MPKSRIDFITSWHRRQIELGTQRSEVCSQRQSEVLMSSPNDPADVNHDTPRNEALEEQDEPLIDFELHGTGNELTEPARRLIEQGRARFKSVDVFAFVPSNYEMLWDMLDALPRGRFCEFGSGWGIATGLAELLGFEALGIELAPELVQASRNLLSEQGLRAQIVEGDYLKRRDQADVYFTYAWPSHMRLIERHFVDLNLPQSKFLYCHGQNDIRCKVLRQAS